MPDDSKQCRGTLDERVRTLLAACRCRLVTRDDIVKAIQEQGRGKRWTWVDNWINEEGSQYLNDMDTVVFDFPSDLSGVESLEFTQLVWRLQPSVFEYQVWSGRCFVRMWWDPNRFRGREEKRQGSKP